MASLLLAAFIYLLLLSAACGCITVVAACGCFTVVATCGCFHWCGFFHCRGYFPVATSCVSFFHCVSFFPCVFLAFLVFLVVLVFLVFLSLLWLLSSGYLLCVFLLSTFQVSILWNTYMIVEVWVGGSTFVQLKTINLSCQVSKRMQPFFYCFARLRHNCYDQWQPPIEGRFLRWTHCPTLHY